MKFCQLLEDAPAISNFVREFTFNYQLQKKLRPLRKPEDASHRKLLLRGVAKLSRVRALYLYSAGNAPDDLLPIIIHLLRLPTCTSLMLSCYLPFGCLALCTNLKCLDIDPHPYCVEKGRSLHQLQEDVGTALDGEHIQFVQETTPPQLVEFRYTANHKFPWGQYIYDEPSALEDTTDLFVIGAKRPDGRPLVDLSRLKKVSIRGTGLEGAPTLKRALKEAGQVEEIQLNTGEQSWHELVHYTHIFSGSYLLPRLVTPRYNPIGSHDFEDSSFRSGCECI